MAFVLADLLQNAKIIYESEEITPGEVGDRLLGKRIHWVAQLVDLRSQGRAAFFLAEGAIRFGAAL